MDNSWHLALCEGVGVCGSVESAWGRLECNANCVYAVCDAH